MHTRSNQRKLKTAIRHDHVQHIAPSSKFSEVRACPFLNVTERNETELNFEPPRYLEEWLVPFPVTDVAFDPVLGPNSPASLVLRLGPESNNFPDICKQTGIQATLNRDEAHHRTNKGKLHNEDKSTKNCKC